VKRLLAFVPIVIVVLTLAPGGVRAAATPAPAPFPEYQALLDQYCIRTGGGKTAFDTQFDYQQLYSDEQLWKSDKSARLDRIHAELTDVRPSTMSPAERLAWALDTYNFLVIERITRHLLVTHHVWVRFDRVEQFGQREGPFFRMPLATIEGRRYTLEQIERTFVYGDTSDAGAPRRTPADPRLSCALCGARRGGPPLSPREFRADSLEAQLDDAAAHVAALPRFFEMPSEHAYRLSQWFTERTPDFGTGDDGALAFIEKYGTHEERHFLRDRKKIYPSSMPAVDGRVNQYDRPKNRPLAPDGS